MPRKDLTNRHQSMSALKIRSKNVQTDFEKLSSNSSLYDIVATQNMNETSTFGNEVGKMHFPTKINLVIQQHEANKKGGPAL